MQSDNRQSQDDALRRSEVLYRTLIECSPDTIMCFDRRYRHLFVSPAVSRVVELRPEQFLGRTHRELGFPEELCRFWEERIEEVFTSGQIRESEFEFEGLHGRVVFNWRLVPVPGPDGTVESVLSIARDITVHRRQEERFGVMAGLLDLTPVSVLVFDLAGNVLYANQRALEYSGYSREEIERANLEELCPLEDRPFIRETLKLLVEKGELSLELTARRKNGSTFPLMATAMIARWGDRPVILSISTDITERKQAEQALAEETVRRRILVEQSRDGIVVLDSDGKVYEANKRYAEMLGYTPEEVLQLHLWDWDTQWTREQLLEMIRQVGATGDYLETRHRRKDGTCYDVEISTNGAICGGRKLIFCVCRDISGRKRAEQALQESEQRFRQMFEHAPLPYQSLDAQGRIIEVNRAWLEELEYAREEVIGRWFGDFLTGDGPALFRERFPLFKARGEIHGAEFELKRKLGEPITVVFEGRIGRDLQGEFQQTHCVFSNITERKRAEVALREQREIMDYVIRHDPNAIAVYDNDLRYIFVSRRYLDDYEVNDRDVIGRHHYEVFPEMPQRWKEIHRRVLSGAIERSEDDRFERPDGSITHNRWECRPWYRADGSIGGMITYTEVTTERKRAEQALRESEQRFRSFVENAHDIIYSLSPDGIFTYVSPNWLEFVGEPAEQAIGRAFELYLHLEDVPSCREFLSTLRDSDQRQSSVEYRIRNKDGAWRRYTSNGSLLRNEAGEVTGYMGIARDITELRQAEARRIELERQLLQSQKLEAIGLLAGGVAHDLNNLLTPILANAEMLLYTHGMSGEDEDAVREIFKAGERARDLVRQLMAFGRKQTLEVKPLDLNLVVTEFSRLLQRTLREDIQLRLSLTPGLGMVLADRSQVEQVLMNLAVNAQDAMPRGGLLVVGTAAAEPGPERPVTAEVLLFVSDNGIGMDQPTSARIFEPFFTTKELGKGTGLGLATVYGIVRQHGGRIEVESRPGKGSTFRIHLPSAEPGREPEEEAELPPERLQGSGTILVAEDDQAVREVTRAILVSLGYRVIRAETPERGLAIAGDPGLSIDLLLTDVVMPGMSGKELYEHLRLIRPGLRVLYMSGYPSDVIARHGVLEQGVSYLQKPFTRQALAQKIRQVLEG